MVPPLVSHMVTARRAGALIDAPLLEERSGEYLLGATSPDIRVLTRWDRERTHFFDLHEEGHQDSVGAFFAAHPHLRDPENLSRSTCAWACGFVTHLIMDQLYITQVYRPHFGVRSALGGSERANLLDRILQYELDRREREDQETMLAVRDALFATAVEIDAGFVDRATLEKWRDVSASVTEHAPDWERFAYIASRHLRQAGVQSESDYQGFLEHIPTLLEETVRTVEMAEVDGFFERVGEQAAQALREYLACR